MIRYPAVEIGQRPRADRLLLGHRLLVTAEPAAVWLLGRRRSERGKQTEIDVHRLERAAARLDGFDMAAGDMAEQGAERRGRRRRRQRRAADVGGGVKTRDQPDACRFHIALAAGHLPGKAQARLGAKAKLCIEQLWRIEKSVAMQPTEACKLR